MSQVHSENAMVENCSIVKIGANFAICLNFRLAKNSFQGSGLFQLNKNTFELWFQKLSEIFELEEDKDFLPQIKGKYCTVHTENGYSISGISNILDGSKSFHFKNNIEKC